MPSVTNLAAAIREQAGKGAARATRRAGRVPAIVYGNKQPPVMISLDPEELRQQIRRTGFLSRVFDITVDGGFKEKALARDIQLDPVTDRPIHVDFMRFSADTRLHVEVQVAFENEDASPGIKRGGVLNVVRRDVKVICAPDNIPDAISINLAGLEIGDSVHISAIELPDGVLPAISDRDFTVATIAAPSTVKPEVDDSAEEEEDGAEEDDSEE